MSAKTSYQRFFIFNLIGLTLTAVAFIYLSRDGRFDLWLANAVYDPVMHRFPLKGNPFLVDVGHTFLKQLTVLLLIAAILGAVSTWFTARFRCYRRALIAFCLMAGSSVTMISSLKAASVHACPWDLAMYGGDAQWFALFDRVAASVDPGHCWPGGHASGGFAIVAGYFSLREQRPEWARYFLYAGLMLGSIMGGVQMLRGAHFLSHNLWTLWIVWSTCLFTDAMIRLVLPSRKCMQCGIAVNRGV